MSVDSEHNNEERKFAVHNPYDDAIVNQVFDANEDDVSHSLEMAERTFASFRRTSAAERSAILSRITNLIKDRAESLAKIVTAEVGKTIRESRYEVSRAHETLLLGAEAAKNITGETVAFDAVKGAESKMGFYMRVPAGVIAAITPFNFPLSLAAHKIASAIAAGNTVVLKPSPKAPLSALELGKIAIEAGLPEGVLNIIPSQRDNLGEALVSDPRVRIVSFTGSFAVAERVAKIIGFKKFLAECGANNAVILAEDADLELVMKHLPAGCFSVAGQICISVQRILVHQSLYDKLVSHLVEAASQLRVGDPSDEGTDMGPLIDEQSAKRVEAWIQQTVGLGAKVVCGGTRNRSFYMPTVLVDVPLESRVWHNEVFGPVVAVRPFSTLCEAINLVNDSVYGLQTGIYTASLDAAMKAFRELNVGGVMINEIPTFRVDLMPYGGVKYSGLGREGLTYAINEMTEIKLCCFSI